MALPMDEQRILEEMERVLAADDPRLAARLSSFGQPSFAQLLRTGRARAAISVLALALIAAIAAVIYMVSAFRLTSPVPAGRTTRHVVTQPISPAASAASASSTTAAATPRPLRGPTS